MKRFGREFSDVVIRDRDFGYGLREAAALRLGYQTGADAIRKEHSPRT